MKTHLTLKINETKESHQILLSIIYKNDKVLVM